MTEETSWERPSELDQYVENPNNANLSQAVELNQGNLDAGLNPIGGDAAGDGIGAGVINSAEQGPLGANLFIYGGLNGVNEIQLFQVFSKISSDLKGLGENNAAVDEDGTNSDSVGKLISIKLHHGSGASGNEHAFASYSTLEAATEAIRRYHNKQFLFGTAEEGYVETKTKVTLKKGDDKANPGAAKIVEESFFS